MYSDNLTGHPETSRLLNLVCHVCLCSVSVVVFHVCLGKGILSDTMVMNGTDSDTVKKVDS